MAEIVACPRCAAALPNDAPPGLCPACLMAFALGDEQAGTTAHEERTSGHPAWSPAEAETVAAELGLVMSADESNTEADRVITPRSSGPPGAPGRLGDYRILREVGRGGMGIVYEAIQETLGRRVALKVLPWHGRLDSGQLERFRLEARSAARLHHTNIVPVFDIGEHDGAHYYSMQFIHGTGLDVVLRDLRRLRDEGPAVARSSNHGEALTVSVALAHGLLDGRAAGTTIASGEAATEAGARPDAGVAIDPIAGPEAPPTPPQRSGLADPSEAHYYRSVARIGVQVADALAYAHAHGVLHRDIKPSNLLLDAAGQVWVADFGLAKLEGSEGPTRTGDIVGTLRYMAPERFDGRSDPRSDLYALGMTLYELMALRPAFDESDRLKLIDRVLHEPPAAPRRLDPKIPRDLETIVLKALAKDPQDRFATAGALGDELRRFVEGRPIRSRPAPFHERLLRWCRRNPELAAATGVAAALTLVLALGSTAAAWTFYQQRNEIAGKRNEIAGNLLRIQQVEADGRERLFEALTERAKAGRFSRRVGQRFGGLEALAQAARIGRDLDLPTARLDVLRDEAIACLALPDLQRSGRVLGKPPGVVGLAFAPAMDRYALRFNSGEVVVRRSADDGELARFRARGARDIFVFRFSPDGRHLATTHFPDFGLTVWDVDRGTVAFEDQGPVFGRSANFSPDGRSVVLAHTDGETSVYDLASGRLVHHWTGPEHTNDLAFRPDGARVAAATHRSTQNLCQITDVATGRVVRSFPLPASGAGIAWSPDGRTLATAHDDRRIYLWDPETGTRTGVLEGHTNGGLYAAFHPSGLLLASNGWENRLRLWDPLLARPVLNLPSTLQELTVGRDGQVVTLVEDELIPYRIDPALEYRTLIRTSGTRMEYQKASVRSDGRLLAVGTDRGVLLSDLAQGREMGVLPIGGAWHVLFEASGDLLTSGSAGVWRWPIRAGSDGTTLRVGPPSRLPLPSSSHDLAEDHAGRVIAVANLDSVHLLSDGHVSRIAPMGNMRYAAVSPDGRWLVTGQHGEGAQVWRVRDAAKVADLPYTGLITVAFRFSPDGRWLIANGGPCRLWEVGTWREARRVGGRGFAFTPDSRLFVVQDPGKMIRLVETETGRTVARLESPDICEVHQAAFTPDGARLVVTTHDGPAVHVWDLRAIRRQLAGRGLDWDAPPYPEYDPAGPEAPPLTLAPIDYGSLPKSMQPAGEPHESVVERTTARLNAAPDDVEARHQRGHALASLRRYAEAVADFDAVLRRRPADAHLLASRADARAALRQFDAAIIDFEAALGNDRGREANLRPRLASCCNNRAWELVTSTPQARDPARAVALARRAAELEPGREIYLNTLGVALYRAGRHDESVTTLEKSLATSRGTSDAFDLFFLAMAHHRLGQTARARTEFDRAIRWRQEHPRQPPQRTRELDAFQAEAEEALAGPLGELPADVFAPATASGR